MIFRRLKRWGQGDPLDSLPPKITRHWWRRQWSLIEVLVVISMFGVAVGLLLPFGVDRDLAHRFTAPDPNSGTGFIAIAGEYYQGDGLGTNWRLSILPDGRYSFISSGCTGVHHRESGRVNRIDGYLVLSPIKSIERKMDRVFLPLKWGSRWYLLPPEKLQDFCDAIIGGDEPQYERPRRFYCLGLDDQVVGTPELPEPWATYLRKNFVIGTIVEVRERGRAKIDLGSTDGIHVGSFMMIQGRGHRTFRELKAVSVNSDSCEVEQIYPDESETLVEVGRKVVTARETEATPER